MDEFTKWDADILGPNTYTSWDDAADGPSETRWDVVPSVIGRTVMVIWEQVADAVEWRI